MPLLFPTVLGVYQYPDTRVFLGPQQQTPRHAISLYPNEGTQSSVLIGMHLTNSRTSKWLGSVRRVRLPDNDGLVVQVNSLSGSSLTTEDLHNVNGNLTFSVEITTLQREVFEWRPTRGREVSMLNGGSENGWKLVWLRDAGEDRAQGAEQPQNMDSSDGGEVVAVCKISAGGSKIVRFRFVGDGEFGHLGGKWEVMAVMSALCLYRRLN